jgi:hypothetical protein
MKYITSILIFTSCFLLNGCNDDNESNPDFKTGLNCTIHYKQGDCMPMVDESKRIYNTYSGKVYIVSKRDYDRLIQVNANCNCIIDKQLDSLKSKSIVLNITNGKLIMELQPDSFIIMPDVKYTDARNSVVYVKPDSIVKADLYYFNCTSY